MLGRSEGKPSKVIYNVPFLVWQSPEWLSTHQFDLNDKTTRPFSNMDFIYAWSDLAGLNYTGFEPEKACLMSHLNLSLVILVTQIINLH